MTISPQKGKQSEFVHNEADIVFFGGSAGSGKTFSLVLIPLMFIDEPSFNAVLMRRTYPEIFNPGGLWEEMESLYTKCGAKANMQEHTWTFPSGMYVQAAHMQHEKDKYKYQGAQVVYFGFDELIHFSKTQFFYMVSRNRKADSPTQPFIRATMNADADSWVAQFISWWIDDNGFAIPERSGRIRWFITKNGQEIWGDSKAELEKKFPNESPLSFTFIEANLSDNPIFDSTQGKDYRAKLQILDPVQRERLLNGNWKIRDHGLRIFTLPSFTEWPEDIDTIAYIDPAYSGKNHTSMAIVGKYEERFKVRGWTWDKHIGELYQEVLSICKRYRVGTLFVESNADKGASARDLHKMRGGFVRPMHEKENKHIRIIRYVHNNWSLIDFANDCEQDFLDCLLNYAEGMEPDDEADALAGAIRAILHFRERQYKIA